MTAAARGRGRDAGRRAPREGSGQDGPILGIAVRDGCTALALVAGDAGRIDAIETLPPASGDPVARTADFATARDAAPIAAGLTGAAEDMARALAEALGVPVVHDMAASDMGLGGRGWPLAPVALHAVVRHLGFEGRVAVLTGDRGAVLTLIDAALSDPAEAGAVAAWDVGPAWGHPSREGPADTALACRLARTTPAFTRHPPRFRDAAEILRLHTALGPASAATRLSLALQVAARGLSDDPPEALLVPDEALALAPDLPCPVDVLPDAASIDAVVAAHLARRILAGRAITLPATTGVAAPVGGGQVVRPRSPRPARPPDEDPGRSRG